MIVVIVIQLYLLPNFFSFYWAVYIILKFFKENTHKILFLLRLIETISAYKRADYRSPLTSQTALNDKILLIVNWVFTECLMSGL